MTRKIGREKPRVLEEIPFASVPGGDRNVLYRTVIRLENSRGGFPSCVFDSDEMAKSWGFVPLTPKTKVVVRWNDYVKQIDGSMRVDVGLREEDVPPGKKPCAFVMGNVHWEHSNEGGLSFEIRTYGIESGSLGEYDTNRLRRSRTPMMDKLTVPYLKSIWV